VALSEEEQQMLNMIAEKMYQDDPKLATSLATSDQRDLNRKRATVAVLVVLVGLALLISSIPLQMLFLGPLGFLITLVGSVILYKTLAQGPRNL